MLEMQIFGINGALEQEWKQAPSGGVNINEALPSN